MAYAIETRVLQPQTTASIRMIVAPAEIGPILGELLPEVWNYLESQGVPPAGPPFTTLPRIRPERVDLEAGLPVAASVASAGRITSEQLPGGRVAVTWHVGPYEGLRGAYQAIEDWLAAEGHEPAGVPWEVYWTDPGEVPDPAAWRTEVFQPIR